MTAGTKVRVLAGPTLEVAEEMLFRRVLTEKEREVINVYADLRFGMSRIIYFEELDEKELSEEAAGWQSVMDWIQANKDKEGT
jgi:hypothetical protein